jgi:hypothetical protein
MEKEQPFILQLKKIEMDVPNLSYVKKLSGGDVAFENQIIAIIKEEFFEEKKIYFVNFHSNNFEEIAENVHKLKHKISILGLEDSYSIAVSYENNLRENSTELSESFESILSKMESFINTL